MFFFFVVSVSSRVHAFTGSIRVSGFKLFLSCRLASAVSSISGLRVEFIGLWV